MALTSFAGLRSAEALWTPHSWFKLTNTRCMRRPAHKRLTARDAGSKALSSGCYCPILTTADISKPCKLLSKRHVAWRRQSDFWNRRVTCASFHTNALRKTNIRTRNPHTDSDATTHPTFATVLGATPRMLTFALFIAFSPLTCLTHSSSGCLT